MSPEEQIQQRYDAADDAMRQLEEEVASLRAQLAAVTAERDEWARWPKDGDDPLPEDNEIFASHPCEVENDDVHKVYAEAMRMVGARRSKAGLVNLVHWLLWQLHEEKRKLDTILYDVNYKGGLQDWQDRAFKAVTGAAEMLEKFAEQSSQLAAARADSERIDELNALVPDDAHISIRGEDGGIWLENEFGAALSEPQTNIRQAIDAAKGTTK